MFYTHLKVKGFTLIELLVVIAIIGILSAVIVAGLNTARLRAADTAVRAEAAQLRIIMNSEVTDTGSYTAVKNGSVSVQTGTNWLQAGNTCTGATGTYATQTINICNALVKATGTTCGTNCVLFTTTNPDSPTKFSIMAYLPYASVQAGAARYVCFGSSGNISISAGLWTEAGCWSNP